jgi:predicted MPP superfamily phosphohydrolase
LKSSLSIFSITETTVRPLIAILIILIFFYPHFYSLEVDAKVRTNETSDFNFAVAGDFGCDKEAKKTIDVIKTKQPELVIALGDLAYKKNPQCWFDLISPLDTNSKFKISFGEHDVSRGNSAYRLYLEHFNLTKPYYSFDYDNIHFLAMATAKNKIIPYNYTSEQYQFVKTDLVKASQNKNIDWIIAYSFRTFYSSNTTHPGLDELQDAYHPLFDKYHVDLVFQAHNHNYQRTFPLSYNTTRQYTPIITDRDTQDYRDIQHGQIFLTAGTGGADFYNFTGQSPYVVNQFLRHGFLNVDSKDNGLKLLVTFYDNNGTALDRMSISKSAK